ncbi:hypothetical protein ACIA8R_43200 [Nonomuraea sp. NPDC051191]|uniref:hypothetical protein n=1 Tax=Nonomuraea sp. NPDC051191 TaxID=3364372 RepID=UPI00378FE669
MDWIYPSPRPAAKEPTAAQRRDYAGFPNLTAVDVVRPDGTPGQKLIATWSTNVDAVMAQTSGMAVSDDGGLTFGPPRATPLREAPVQLHDGRLFGTAYYLTKVDARTNELDVHTSTDLGQTWDTARATFTSPDELVGGGVAHGVPVQLADRTVLVTVYARYTVTGGKNQAELYASADGGRTFARRGVIARPAGETTYNETAVEQTADGSLLASCARTAAPTPRWPGAAPPTRAAPGRRCVTCSFPGRAARCAAWPRACCSCPTACWCSARAVRTTGWRSPPTAAATPGRSSA